LMRVRSGARSSGEVAAAVIAEFLDVHQIHIQ